MIFADKLKRNLRPREVFILDVFMSLVASMGVISVLNIIIPAMAFDIPSLATWIAASGVASMLAFYFFRLYRAIIRYSTLREIGRLFAAVATKDALLGIAMSIVSPLGPSNELLWTMLIADFLFTVFLLQIMRVAMVMVYDIVRTRVRDISKSRRVLVYGITDKAASAVSRLRNSKNYRIIGFIAPGDTSVSLQLMGMPVYFFKKAADVKAITENIIIDGVLYPYEADARAEQNRLINFCFEAELKTYIIPRIDEVTDGHSLSTYVRKINIEDLLGRPEITIPMADIIANFEGKNVMVTGAAGSIGSELCRQLARFGVKQLILFDNAETPLHNIRLELEDKFPQLNFAPVIGDVRSQKRLDFVFSKYKPDIVFHAAAYKHVPLMEENPCEAVRVNVSGSRMVADNCVKYGVEKMIMISTDKAVNPTNIMGCTKRLAEIYVQSLGLAIERGQVKGKTEFVTTRFGNVLGSNGSVIPRFREQIEHGGPVTVTHPEINRFFMTIPEACRLVMEAATFARGTQIFVFDMGKPVKICTLAERMIQLAGLEVGRDIKIEFTGLRPGEKLYEEVLATKENTIPTQHERIFVAKAREYSYEAASAAADKLDHLAAEVEIPQMVRFMKSTVPEFKSKHSEFEIYDVQEATAVS